MLRNYIILIIIIQLTGCTSIYSQYEISSVEPITFEVVESIQPPSDYYRELIIDVQWDGTRKLRGSPPPLQPSEKWEATHQIGDYILIQSKTYQDRLCHHIAKSDSCYSVSSLFGTCLARTIAMCPGKLGLLVTKKGEIHGGWISMHDPCMFSSCTDKYVINPDNVPVKNWPNGKVFRFIENSIK